MFLSSRRGNLSSGPLLGPGGAEPGQLETLSSGFSHLSGPSGLSDSWGSRFLGRGALCC